MSKKNRTRTYPHKDVTICLDGALAAERDTLMAQVKGRKSPELAKQIRDVEDRMRDSLLTIRVMGVSRGRYGEIQQPFIQKDGTIDLNGFFPEFVYKTGFEVEEDGAVLTPLGSWDRAEWDEISEGLTDGEYADIANAVIALNRKRVETGFLSRGSVQTEPSSQNSEQLEPGE